MVSIVASQAIDPGSINRLTQNFVNHACSCQSLEMKTLIVAWIWQFYDDTHFHLQADLNSRVQSTTRIIVKRLIHSAIEVILN